MESKNQFCLHQGSRKKLDCARLKQVSRAGGFTLLELLIVFATVAVLASLLLPSLGKAKSQSLTTRCASNLHQLGMGLSMYTDMAGAYPLSTSNGFTGLWQTALQTEVPGLVFSCPTLIPPSTNFTKIFQWGGGQILPHYGYNVMGAVYEGCPPYNLGLGGDVDLTTGSRIPTDPNRVVFPAQMITMADSPTFLYLGVGTQPQSNISSQIYLAYPYLVSAFNYPGVGDWHGSNANCLFDDEHVQLAPQSYWTAATDQSRRLWNSDNQPHEEWW